MIRTIFCGFLVALLCFSSCKKELFDDGCLDGVGAIEKRKITLPKIDRLRIGIQYELTLIETGEQEIEIEAASNVIDYIEANTEITNNTWKLDSDGGCFKDLPIKITASLPGLKELNIDGPITITVDEQLDDIDSSFLLFAQGPVMVDLDLGYVKDIQVQCSLGSAIKLSGEADKMNLIMVGGGNFDGRNFDTRKVSALINSDGDAKVAVSDTLSVNFSSGNGNICYEGNPIVETTAIAGTGEVRNCD